MKPAPRIVRRLLWGISIALSAGGALPQTPTLYTVEIVVFRNGSDVGALPGPSAQAAPVPPPVDAQTPAGNPPPAAGDATPAAAADSVDAMPVATSRLNSAAARLASKAGLVVLAHVAWSQMPTAWNSRIGISAAQLGLGNGLSGKIFLERGQYLHLGMDLTLDSNGQHYVMDEVRKVKVNEIHYFDRPALGVLAIVTSSG